MTAGRCWRRIRQLSKSRIDLVEDSGKAFTLQIWSPSFDPSFEVLNNHLTRHFSKRSGWRLRILYPPYCSHTTWHIRGFPSSLVATRCILIALYVRALRTISWSLCAAHHLALITLFRLHAPVALLSPTPFEKPLMYSFTNSTPHANWLSQAASCAFSSSHVSDQQIYPKEMNRG